MRIRFLKNEEYNGTRTVVVDNLTVIEDCRFFVEFGKIFEIKDYILDNDGHLAIVTNDDCVFRSSVNNVELFEPSGYTSYTPSNCGCKK